MEKVRNNIQRFFANSKLFWDRRWITTTFLLVGVSSIILLVLVHWYNNKLIVETNLYDALMDAQIHLASSRIYFKEAIQGDESMAEQSLAHLDQSSFLISVVLQGGVSENGNLVKPLRQPELKSIAEKIMIQLAEFKKIIQKSIDNPQEHVSGGEEDERVADHYKDIFFNLRSLEVLLEDNKVVDERRWHQLFFSLLGLWSLSLIGTVIAISQREIKRKKASLLLSPREGPLPTLKGNVQERRQRVSELLRKSMDELSSIDELIRYEILDRRETEKTLRARENVIKDLSSQLIDAQEVERKRISMELHDELSQALNVLKFQLLGIEKGLRDDQDALTKECIQLREYVDTIIVDIRRLSLSLSPIVLDDIGLTSALRWYISNVPTSVRVKVNIKDVDDLIATKHWITIYRIVQEALTNITKHADAKNILVDIKPHEDSVLFFIEDDGIGFNLSNTIEETSLGKGLGLRTMSERVKLMGGVIDIWSEKMKGTSITFGIPVEKEDS